MQVHALGHSPPRRGRKIVTSGLVVVSDSSDTPSVIRTLTNELIDLNARVRALLSECEESED